MSKLTENPIISGVIASILFAMIAAGYSKWSNRVDPEEQAEELSQEIKNRVASAESLLRNTCVSARPAIISAYGMLNAPHNDAPFKMATFLKPNPQHAQKTLFDLSQALFVQAKDVNILYPYLERKNVAKIRSVSQSVTDNFNPVTLLGADDSEDQLGKIRKRFRKILLSGYQSMYSTTEERQSINDIYVQKKLMTQIVSNILSTVESFDPRNEGYWWSSCNEQVIRCFKLTRAEGINHSFSLGGSKNILANLHMMFMFDHFIASRKVPYDPGDLKTMRYNKEELETHQVLYRAEFETCENLFRTVYPSAIAMLVNSGLAVPRLSDE